MTTKLSILTLLVATTFNAAAESPTTPIDNLFDAMREHNGDKLLAQFTGSAMLQRAKEDGSIHTSDIQKFADALTHSKAYLDEQLLASEVHESGNLASVWTPYVFYRDKQISHCGVNSFQLVKSNDGWKIHYLIDNVFQGDCESFRNTYGGE